jgi:hypothetical protein
VKAELLKETNRQFEVIDDDSYVIQPFERHASNLQDVWKRQIWDGNQAWSRNNWTKLDQVWKCYLAPQVGLEPTTLRLTAECSAIELLRSVLAGLSELLLILPQT